MVAATVRLQNTRNKLYLNTSAFSPSPYGNVMIRSCVYQHNVDWTLRYCRAMANRQGRQMAQQTAPAGLHRPKGTQQHQRHRIIDARHLI